MERSLEFRKVQNLPVALRRRDKVDEYAIRLTFLYDCGGPPAEGIVRVMQALGKHAEEVVVSRIEYSDVLSVVSSRRGNLRRAVFALTQEFNQKFGPVRFGYEFPNPDNPSREVVYPRPDNS